MSEQSFSAGCLTIIGVFLLLFGGWCVKFNMGFPGSGPEVILLLVPGILVIGLAILVSGKCDDRGDGSNRTSSPLDPNSESAPDDRN